MTNFRDRQSKFLTQTVALISTVFFSWTIAQGQKTDTLILGQNEKIIKEYYLNGQLKKTTYTKGLEKDTAFMNVLYGKKPLPKKIPKGDEKIYIMKEYGEKGNLKESYYSFQDTSYIVKCTDSSFYNNGKIHGIYTWTQSWIEKTLSKKDIYFTENGKISGKYYFENGISIDSLYTTDSLFTKDDHILYEIPGTLQTVIIGNGNNPRTIFLRTVYNHTGEIILEEERGNEIKTIREYKNGKLIHRQIFYNDKLIGEDFFK